MQAKNRRIIIALFMVIVLLFPSGCRKANVQINAPEAGQAVQQVLDQASQEYNRILDETVDRRLNDAVRVYENEDGTCTSQEQYDGALAAAKDTADEMQKEGLLSYVEAGEGYVFVRDAQGICTLYEPNIPGYMGAGNGISIYAVEPCQKEFYDRWANSNYSWALEYDTSRITNLIKRAAKEGNLNVEKALCLKDDEVTLQVIESFHKDSIIVWDGHGGYVDSVGPTVQLDIKPDALFCSEHFQELKTGQLIKSLAGESIHLSPAYFDEVFEEGDLDNTLIVLCTCHSLQDDRLASVLVSKGALTVFGFTDRVFTVYCEDVIETFVDQFSTGKTVYDCLQYLTLNKLPYDDFLEVFVPFGRNKATFDCYGDWNTDLAIMERNMRTGIAHPTGAPVCIADYMEMTYGEIMNAVQWKETYASCGEDYSETNLWQLRAITDTVAFEFTFQGVMQYADEKPVELHFTDKNLGQSRVIHISETIENGMTYEQIAQVEDVSELEEVMGIGGAEYRLFKCRWAYNGMDVVLFFNGSSEETAMLFEVWFNGDYDTLQ